MSFTDTAFDSMSFAEFDSMSIADAYFDLKSFNFFFNLMSFADFNLMSFVDAHTNSSIFLLFYVYIHVGIWYNSIKLYNICTTFKGNQENIAIFISITMISVFIMPAYILTLS